MRVEDSRPAAGGSAERGAVCSLEGERADDNLPAIVIKPGDWRAPKPVFADPKAVVESATQLLCARISILAAVPGKPRQYGGETLANGVWSETVSSPRAAATAARDLFRGYADANLCARVGAGGVVILRVADAVADDFHARLNMLDQELPTTWSHRDPTGATCWWFRYPATGPSLADAKVYGADVFASAGTTPAPPSVERGLSHAWDVGPGKCEIAELPKWLAAFCAPRANAERNTTDSMLADARDLAIDLLGAVDALLQAEPAWKEGEQARALCSLQEFGLAHQGANDEIEELVEWAAEGSAAGCSIKAYELVQGHFLHLQRTDDRSQADIVPLDLARMHRLPRREWVVKDIAAQRRVSVVAGPGGSAKSTISMALAVSIATGYPILGAALAPETRGRVLYVPGEDDDDDWLAKAAAVCARNGIDRSEIEGWLFIEAAGRRILTNANGDAIEGAVERLVAFVRRHNIDLVIFDPLSSFHVFGIVDNGSGDRAIKTVFGQLAREGNCAVAIIHHTRKLGDREAGIDDVLGGGAIVSASRATHLVTPMSDAEAASYGIDSAMRDRIRKLVVKKANFGATGLAFWFKLDFPRILDEAGDASFVATAVPWEPPAPYLDVAPAVIRICQGRVEAGRPDGAAFRYSDRVKDRSAWAGQVLADELNLDSSNPRDKRQIKQLLDQWIDAGWLTKTDRYVDGKKPVPIILVGQVLEPD